MQRQFHQSQQSVTTRVSHPVPCFNNHDVVLQSLQVFGSQGKRHHLQSFIWDQDTEHTESYLLSTEHSSDPTLWHKTVFFSQLPVINLNFLWKKKRGMRNCISYCAIQPNNIGSSLSAMGRARQRSP